MGWRAYVDESMRTPSQDQSGLYILAAAIIDDIDCVNTRAAVAALRPRPAIPKFHWRKATDAARHHAIKVLTELPTLHLVVVGTPLGKQERARRQCLEQLLMELDKRGVDHVALERRQRRADHDDITVIDAFRACGTLGPELRVTHLDPRDEALLWMPDIVAGATNWNDPTYLRPIEHLIERYDITLR